MGAKAGHEGSFGAGADISALERAAPDLARSEHRPSQDRLIRDSDVHSQFAYAPFIALDAAAARGLIDAVHLLRRHQNEADAALYRARQNPDLDPRLRIC